MFAHFSTSSFFQLKMNAFVIMLLLASTAVVYISISPFRFFKSHSDCLTTMFSSVQKLMSGSKKAIIATLKTVAKPYFVPFPRLSDVVECCATTQDWSTSVRLHYANFSARIPQGNRCCIMCSFKERFFWPHVLPIDLSLARHVFSKKHTGSLVTSEG